MTETMTPNTEETTEAAPSVTVSTLCYLAEIAVPWPTRMLWANKAAFIRHFVR
jgi:hypothetical protein